MNILKILQIKLFIFYTMCSMLNTVLLSFFLFKNISVHTSKECSAVYNECNGYTELDVTHNIINITRISQQKLIKRETIALVKS